MKTPVTVHLLMYDITHEQTLRKVAKLLQQHGYERINYSVWLGWHHPGANTELFAGMREMLRQKEAKGSRMYHLAMSLSGFKKIKSISGRKPPLLAYWTGEQKIRFF